MRVLLSTYGSRGDVEPMVGLAVLLRALGVPPVLFGRRWRSWQRPSSELGSRPVSPHELCFSLLEGGVHVVAQLARARGGDDFGGGRC